jgi:predicted peroxiredoxin
VVAMAKMAIVVLSGSENPTRSRAGLHVAKRIHDARPENGVDVVDVFLFTDGLRLLSERGGQSSAGSSRNSWRRGSSWVAAGTN